MLNKRIVYLRTAAGVAPCDNEDLSVGHVPSRWPISFTMCHATYSDVLVWKFLKSRLVPAPMRDFFKSSLGSQVLRYSTTALGYM